MKEMYSSVDAEAAFDLLNPNGEDDQSSQPIESEEDWRGSGLSPLAPRRGNAVKRYFARILAPYSDRN